MCDVYGRYGSRYLCHSVPIDRSHRDGGFGGTRDGLLAHENPRVGWAEHQASAGQKRDISCLFSVGCIYWRCASAARLCGSLIRPVGPNRTGWTRSSDAVLYFCKRTVLKGLCYQNIYAEV